jgi:hypothetical protein
MVRIDNLNFENEKPIHSTRTICAMHSTIAQLISIYIYIKLYNCIHKYIFVAYEQIGKKKQIYICVNFV